MGLLLSILVACVGVVELLGFYYNVTSNVVTTCSETELANLSPKRLEDLDERGGNRCNGVLNSTNQKTDSNGRVVFSEDIEVEFTRDVVATKPRSPTPRRFLLIEKEDHDRSRSGSPRRFVITSDTEDGNKENVPKFTVEGQKDASKQHFLIRDVENREQSPIPLPKRFIMTEKELGIFKVEGKPCCTSSIPKRVPHKKSTQHQKLEASVNEDKLCSIHEAKNALKVTQNDEIACQQTTSNGKVVLSEDIEVEFTQNVVTVTPRSPTPRRFLLTEKENHDRSRSGSPRRFVITNDTEDGAKRKLPKFTVEEQTASQHFLIRDVDNREGSPIPLPKQFIVTEKELGIFKVEGKPCSTSSVSNKVVQKDSQHLSGNKNEAEISENYLTSKTLAKKGIEDQKLEAFVNEEKLCSVYEARNKSEISQNEEVSCQKTTQNGKVVLSEDIEVEFTQNVVTTKPRSPTPRRFLLTEKENHDRSRSGSPRRFVITNDTEDGAKLKLPKFTVEEQTASQHFLIRDVDNREGSPIPLPKQFIVTEKELGIFKVEGKPCSTSSISTKVAQEDSKQVSVSKNETEISKNYSTSNKLAEEHIQYKDQKLEALVNDERLCSVDEAINKSEILQNEEVSCQKTSQNGKILLSEDIEVEFTQNVVTTRPRSPTPRRFLLTEKEHHDRSRSGSPRRFVITNDTEDGSKEKIPQFTVEEQEGSSQQHFLIRDIHNKEGSPIPLPKQFIVTEKEIGIFKVKGQVCSTSSTSKEIQQSASTEKKLVISENEKAEHLNSSTISERQKQVTKENLEIYQKEEITNSKSSAPQEVVAEDSVVETKSTNEISVTVEKTVLSRVVEDSIEFNNTKKKISKICDEEIDFKPTENKLEPSLRNEEVDIRRFIETEKESEISACSKKEENVEEIPRSELKEHSRSPSPIPKRLGEDEVFRRSPSPYPPLILPVPRNSISNELVDNPAISVKEVEEEWLSRSPTPENIDQILETNTKIQSKTNNLEVPITRPRSHSPECRKDEIDDDTKYNDQFLDSLDGVKKKKICRNSASRKSRKPSNTKKEFCLPSSSDNDAQIAKTLTEAANVLKNVNREDGEKPGSSKKSEPEPFWLIFSGEYTKAMNKDWHGQHFCCWQCDESLTGQRYVLRDEHPYCVSCYESVFANSCEKCSRIIGIDSKDLSYKDKHWHEACFLCTTCGESLVDRQFGSKGDRIYCGRCYDEQFASRCDGCHEIFRAGTKKMEYKTRQWHEKCFCCCVCKVPIGTQSFIPREQEIYCAKCYEEKFATRCIKCNKVITSGGVTYKNEPWHRECFTCTNCAKSLAGERFTSRDEKPYCAECFGELFAKRCFACKRPITGIGGTKFISFEDRHWHNDCFFCASCRTSLVGRGFITDNDDIICPECAKQKLI